MSIDMLTVQSLAREACGFFETRTRADGTIYVCTTDDAPGWVGDLVRRAHFGLSLPDDWRYSRVWSALECVGESDDPQGAAHEWADAEVDVYDSDRIEWLGSASWRADYCDEACVDMGAGADVWIIERIGLGQYAEACEVFGLVLAALEDEERDRA